MHIIIIVLCLVHVIRLYWCCYQTMIVSILFVQEVPLYVMCGDDIGVHARTGILTLACSIVLLLTLLLTI